MLTPHDLYIYSFMSIVTVAIIPSFNGLSLNDVPFSFGLEKPVIKK